MSPSSVLPAPRWLRIKERERMSPFLQVVVMHFFTCVDDDNVYTQQNLHVISATGMAVQGETFSSFAREGSECHLTFTCLINGIATSLSTHPNAVFPQNCFSCFICISLPWLAWPGMETATQVQVNTLHALPWCAAFFLAQIPSVKREGETIASGECDDDVEHRAHVLPCAHKFHICKPY